MDRLLKPKARPCQASALPQALPNENVSVIFSIDCQTGKIASVVPCVRSDQEMRQVEAWIEAVLILSDLIRPARIEERAAA